MPVDRAATDVHVVVRGFVVGQLGMLLTLPMLQLLFTVALEQMLARF